MMRNLISEALAGNILLAALALLAVFHVLVLIRVVPPDFIWGGQAADGSAQMVTLELLALVVILLFALVVAVRMDYLLPGRVETPAAIGLWIMVGYFILNTIGNLASGIWAEKVVFALLTLVMALCAFRLAIE
jgi:hypothetical protein